MDKAIIYTIIVVAAAVAASLGTLLYLYPPHPSASPPPINSSQTTPSNATSTTVTPQNASSPIALLQSLKGAFTLNLDQLDSLISYMPQGVTINRTANTIRFTGKTIYIVMLAGPPSNILSFQSFNLTNPTIEVPLDSTVIIAIIDAGYLNHSFGITSSAPPYPASVSPNQYPPAFPGSEMPPTLLVNGLSPASANVFSGYLIQFNATETGTYWYLCFVPGHASSGMYGKFIVYG